MPPRNAWLRQAIPLHGQLIPCIEYNGRIVPPFNLAQFHPKLSLLWAIRVLHPCRQLMSVGHGWVKAREDWRSLAPHGSEAYCWRRRGSERNSSGRTCFSSSRNQFSFRRVPLGTEELRRAAT